MTEARTTGTFFDPDFQLPLFDLSRQWPRMRDEVLALVDDLAGRGSFSLGGELDRFEAEFARYVGTAESVGTSSGTSAIELALRALGVGPGDEVITVASTFIATIEAIAATGATPLFVDIDPSTRCIDPPGVRAAITPKTAAVVVVHLYGYPAPADEVATICRQNGLALIEDCAQAHGAALGGRGVGTFGAAGAFSFYPTKNLGAFGDGGAVSTSDPALAAAVRSLRHHGCSPHDANRHVRADGGTERLDNLQAAVLSVKLRSLDADNASRQTAARQYREMLGGLPLTLPPEDPGDGAAVHHLFVVEIDERDRVRAQLAQFGVRAGVHYPTPAHLQPAFRVLGHRPGELPASERLAARGLSLPIFPGIEPHEQEHVADALAAAL